MVPVLVNLKVQPPIHRIVTVQDVCNAYKMQKLDQNKVRRDPQNRLQDAMSSYRGLSQHVDFDRLPSPESRFELEDLIGEGTYGEVFSARDNETGQRVAVKVLENLADNVEEIEEEFLVLRDLSLHPNIPAFYGLYLKRGSTPDEDQLWFVMELCTGGSVTDLVQGLKRRNQRLTEEQIAYILRETVDALIYLHQNHCMHRDVKGHNILLTEDAKVKLVDFGVSSHLAATLARRNTSVGTPYWMAPEVIACEQQLDASYDARCDVWSIGVTAIELAEGDPPLAELHPMRALFQIPRNPPPQLTRAADWSPQLQDFISECLVKDLEQRPFTRELLEHPLLKEVPIYADKVRRDLQEEIRRQRVEGRVPRQPEVTTKHGQLKPDRRSRPQPIYVDDLAALESLSEDIIVQLLRRRFEQEQIYTYIGDILVAANPFIDLGLYSNIEMNRYRSQSRADHPPHIFAVADAAYHALLHQRQNQCVVISGESGAGKTESANLLLKQLVYLGKAPNRNLEDKILQVNPIMEAFGNARTGINDNSSRFGKYLDLTFTHSGKVTGARISVYLLEQSRVVRQAEGERNFHVFYYLYDGLEADHRLDEFFLDLSLRPHHKYLGGDSKDTITRKTNIDKFRQVRAGFKLLGFREEEIDTVYRVLSSILHVGDIEFGEATSRDNTDKSRVIDLSPLHRVSKLLGVEACDLLEALTSNSVVTRGETITRNNTVQEARSTRDAMAKGLYGRLFDWLVNQINRLLSISRLVYGEPLAVGLLDIFGFENFPQNSFEQLCINIANEQIQYYFNQHIFTWEQQEYMAEGIPVDLVEFADNRPVLDMLLSRPLGLLSLLDEESRFPRSTDRTLTDKFHGNIKNKHYIRPKSNMLTFSIQHYAGRVTYTSEGFLEKNRNFLPPEIIQLLRQSNFDIIRYLFQCPLTKTGNLYSATPRASPKASPRNTPDPNDKHERYASKGLASQSRAQQTVATYFRYSLMDLLQKMVGGSPQFVRCIKPNDGRIARLFDTEKVIQQLRYTGVLETIRIRQHGFSHRLTFAEFLRRYCFLAFNFDERVVANRDSCRLLLIRLKMDGWALGKTKVFLKYYHVEYLSKLYEEQVRRIVLVQACVRRWLARIRFEREKWRVAQSVVTMQRYVRGWLTRRRTAEERRKSGRNDYLLPSRKSGAEGKQRNGNRQKRKKPAAGGVSWMKARMMGAIATNESGDESDREDESPKDNRVRQKQTTTDQFGDLTKEEAAVIIQSHFRGYTVRRRWGPELEFRIRKVLSDHTDPNDAHQALRDEGISADEAALIIQRCYRNWRVKDPNKGRNRNNQRKRSAPVPPNANIRGDRQAELITFSQNVHMLNQEAHKYLRRNKPTVRLTELDEAPDSYVRPRGFQLFSRLARQSNNPSNQGGGGGRQRNKRQAPQQPIQRPEVKITSCDQTVSYYNALQKEMTSSSPEFDDDDPWDAPLTSMEQKLRPNRARLETINLQEHRRRLVQAGLRTQDQENRERESRLMGQWSNALQTGNQNQGGNQVAKKLPLSRIGRQVVSHALEQRIKELKTNGLNPAKNNDRRNNYGNNNSSFNGNEENFVPGSDLRQLLRQNHGARSNIPNRTSTELKSTDDNSNADDFTGPYNFRGLLRPTDHAPTESLRKRKGLNGSSNGSTTSGNTSNNNNKFVTGAEGPVNKSAQNRHGKSKARKAGSDALQDSPNKRRPRPRADAYGQKYNM